MSESTHQHTDAYRRGDRSPETLEDEIDAERIRIAETIEALQEKFSMSNVIDEAVRSIGTYGGEFGRGLGRRARDNPLPLVLTGVGLAWLIASSGRSDSGRHARDEDYLWDVEDDELYELEGEPPVAGYRYGAAGVPSYGPRPYGTERVGGPYRSGSNGPAPGDRLRHAAGEVSERAADAAGSVSRGAGQAADAVSDRAGRAIGAASSGARSAAGTASAAADSAESVLAKGADRVAGGARRAADAVSRGLGSAADTISSGGRGAYRAGRGAYGAGRQVVRRGRHSGERVGSMIEEHPLVVGALAFALGAALGGALPRTRVEDEYMGDYSDETMERARETALSEAEKARRVGRAVYDEARDMARETREDLEARARETREDAERRAREARDDIEERAKEGAHQAKRMAEKAGRQAEDAAEHLRDTAKEEARKQDLGKPEKPA